MKKLKITLSVLIALVTVVALVGCKNSQQGGANTDRKASNSVVVGITQDLDSLDPHNAESAGTREVLFNLFEGLVKPTPEGELEGAVASQYEIADDAMSITFTLRDGIKFSDGTDVTAEDVKYSIDRYALIQGEGSAYSNIQEVKIVDPKTIQVVLNEPNAEFIYYLTCAVIPKANEANINSAPVGTGPFKFASYTPGEQLIVEKNENYWKEGYPYLDKATFKVVAEPDMIAMELKAGTIDIYQHLVADQVSAIGKGFDILKGSENMVQALYMNNAYEPFANEKVRQAICYAIDKDAINAMVLDGNSHLIGTHFIPGIQKYYDESTENTYKRDAEKAKKLLKEAGYENLSFTITVPSNLQIHISTAEVIVENLAEANITAKIKMVDWPTWLSTVYQGNPAASDASHGRDYEATVIAVDNRYLAPTSWFERYQSINPNNFMNYKSKTFDEMFNKVVSETNENTKEKYIKELQKIVTNEAAAAYIEDPAILVAVNSALEGYVFYPISAQDLSVVKYK